ncbi:transglutaminase-like domain-containing protein [Haloimpatiens sp. FM7315]|uniref:transglutaminase-like domain-containing protein n=1 Tax=Haloimpatiens sp. FM7315 TaxID=3298609 RepID=UPI0035A3B5E5
MLLIFIYPILKGFIIKFSSRHLKEDVLGVEGNFSFVLSLIFGIHWMKNIFFNHTKGIYSNIYELIPESILKYVSNKPIVIYIVVIPIAIFIIHNLIMFIFRGINTITVFPLFDGIESGIREKSSFLRRILGSVFQIPKSICYIIILAFVLNFLSMLNLSENLNLSLGKSKYYNYICQQVVIPINNSKLAKKLPNIVNNSFKIVVKREIPKDSENKTSNETSKTIIYYNGITLDEGVKSNKEINAFAVDLVKNSNTDREKAEKIYDWISKNIIYDNDKADKIFKNIYDSESGAIPTYNSRTGICFDYSCLYVAMCRANGIKVRIVTGKGFNGVSWIGHAWNEVYLKEEKQWLNVDTTFAKGGDYFGSRRFMIDHKDGKIADEW